MLMDAAFIASLPPLPLPGEMRRWDAGAVALGMPEMLLMENAGQAALDVLRLHMPDIAQERVWLFMGGGNNGGDAACLGRRLLDAGADVLVWHTKALGDYKGAAAGHMRLAGAAGVAFAPARRLKTDRLRGVRPGIVVDGLTGSGLEGELRPDLRQLIEIVNSLSARFVLALDVPSGLHGLTGRPCPVAVRAHATVAFAAARPGLVLPWARDFTGRLHVRDIGIPVRARSKIPCGARLLDVRALAAIPEIAQGAYKNLFGHVLVLGGIAQYSGAVHLAARGALRAGAGLVSVASPTRAAELIKNGLPEIMTLPLGGPDAGTCADWPETPPENLLELIGRCDALVIGPGMGRGESARVFLAAVLALPQRPAAVVDADALVLLAGHRDLQSYITKDDILTPHPGEAAALLRVQAAAVQADRFDSLNALCRLVPGVVLLKGAGSLASRQADPFLVSPYDIPQLAVGGSGDVLAGCIGALLARGRGQGGSLAAAGLGLVLHALAGLKCAARYPERGNTAGEIADAIPPALALCRRQPGAIP